MIDFQLLCQLECLFLDGQTSLELDGLSRVLVYFFLVMGCDFFDLVLVEGLCALQFVLIGRWWPMRVGHNC